LGIYCKASRFGEVSNIDATGQLSGECLYLEASPDDEQEGILSSVLFR